MVHRAPCWRKVPYLYHTIPRILEGRLFSLAMQTQSAYGIPRHVATRPRGGRAKYGTAYLPVAR